MCLNKVVVLQLFTNYTSSHYFIVYKYKSSSSLPYFFSARRRTQSGIFDKVSINMSSDIVIDYWIDAPTPNVRRFG